MNRMEGLVEEFLSLAKFCEEEVVRVGSRPGLEWSCGFWTGNRDTYRAVAKRIGEVLRGGEE